MALALTRRLQGVVGLRQLMPVASGLQEGATDLQQQRFAGEGVPAGVGGRPAHCGTAAVGLKLGRRRQALTAGARRATLSGP